MTVARTYAEWALALDGAPTTVRRTAARHILDALGTAIAAARTDAVLHVIDTARRFGTAPESTVIGYGMTLPAPAAALANGALIHALDFDDTHADALVHMTAAVLPAALAVGEEVMADGAIILNAVIAGYEVAARIGAAVTHGFHARGFHATSVCGVFASALVAARLYGLSVDQVVNALGIAGSLAAGSLEFLNTGSSTKQLHPGFSGMNGILAARLAAAGADGPETIFEGSHGLFRSFLGVDVDSSRLVDALGTRWETERITIKPYPACQLSHASLDALRAAGVAHPKEILDITFEVPPDSVTIVCEPVASKLKPRTPYEGKFSLPYCAASLLIDGALAVDAFDEARLSRRNVLELAAKVHYKTREFDGAPADAPGIAEVRFRNGSVLRGEVKGSHGTPSDPLTESEVVAKFVANCGGASPKASKLAADVLDLGTMPLLTTALKMTEDFR